MHPPAAPRVLPLMATLKRTSSAPCAEVPSRGGVPDDALERLAPRPYEALRTRIRTGDLFLCSGDDVFSRMIRAATRSPWSHVAIALRLDEIGRIVALEAVAKIGVRIVPLSAFVSSASNGRKPYPGRILLARHHGFQACADREAIARMVHFAVDRCGSPFAGGEMIKIAARIALGAFDREMPRILTPDDEFICSEYAARCYAQAGVEIPWDGRGFIAPADFAADPRTEALAQVQTL